MKFLMKKKLKWKNNMIDTDKIYSLEELLKLYNMYNFEFRFYGNNENGKIDVYMKTDMDKISVFSSVDSNMTKKEYISLNEEEAKKLKFKFDREVEEVNLDIVAVVLRTSDVNIPSTKYSLETLDKLTKEQDQEVRTNKDGEQDGICYLIVDHNTGCNLYDGVYLFDKNNKGLIEDLKEKYETESDELIKDNLRLILNYCKEIDTKEVTR